MRDRKKFDEVNPFAYSYEKDSDDLFGRLGDDYKRLMKQVISELCTDVFVVDNELATYLPGAKIMPRAVDLSDWPFVGPTSRDRPLVIHAPNRRVVKGTDYILKAVEELKAKGVDFDFWLVEGLSNIEARELYKQADIVIDQLRIGWYGVLAVEAMALGKTVIAYIREDLLQVEENTLPLINANPNTIKDILEQTINDGPLRKRLSFEAREYVERVHGSEAVCIRLLEAYKTPNHRDLGHSLLDLQGYQNYQWMLKGSAALRKKIDDGKSPIPTTSKARFRLACRIIKASLYSRN